MPAYQPGAGSAKYLGFLKSVRATRGLRKNDPDPIAWGKVVGGFQAGLVLPATIRRGDKVRGWILIRNTSDQVKEFKVTYSWNVIKLLAVDGNGKELVTNDLYMKLWWGTDAIMPAKLQPGEHLEFWTYEVAITPAKAPVAPCVKIGPLTKVAKLRYVLSMVLGGNGGVGAIETGSAEVVLEAAIAGKAGVIKPRAELAKAKPSLP